MHGMTQHLALPLKCDKQKTSPNIVKCLWGQYHHVRSAVTEGTIVFSVGAYRETTFS